MRILDATSVRSLVLVTVLVVATGAAAQADPLTTFTVTDLGMGSPTFSTNAIGNGVVVAPNGQSAYPFQLATPTSLNPSQLLASGFPRVVPQPPGGDSLMPGPNLGYSNILNPSTNGNGYDVAVNWYGYSDQYQALNAYYAKQNPDGTWGSPVSMWSINPEGGAMPDGSSVSITGINKLNEVLGIGKAFFGNGTGLNEGYLYNINTNTLLDLGNLDALAPGRWAGVMPIAIDDQGRILVSASSLLHLNEWETHTLLLTPEGVSSPMSAWNTPEPGTMAVAMAMLGALAVRRAVGSLRRTHTDRAISPC